MRESADKYGEGVRTEERRKELTSISKTHTEPQAPECQPAGVFLLQEQAGRGAATTESGLSTLSGFLFAHM